MFKKILASLLALFAAAAFAAVDVNKATQAELESVKGIGPAISGRILEDRKKSTFKDWAELVTRVKGVGEGNAAKFSTAGLTVNGAAFSGAPAAPVSKATVSKTDKAASKPAAPADSKPAPADDQKASAAAAKADRKAAKAAAKASAPADMKK